MALREIPRSGQPQSAVGGRRMPMRHCAASPECTFATIDRSRSLRSGGWNPPAPYGQPEMYYSLPINRMERIELLKASGSTLYGPHTIGGVMNFITPDPPSRQEMKLGLSGGAIWLFCGTGLLRGLAEQLRLVRQRAAETGRGLAGASGGGHRVFDRGPIGVRVVGRLDTNDDVRVLLCELVHGLGVHVADVSFVFSLHPQSADVEHGENTGPCPVDHALFEVGEIAPAGPAYGRWPLGCP